MIVSNLFRKVDKSWLPFFYSFFQSDEGKDFVDYINYNGSRGVLFPKYMDIFKPFENISVDKVKILLVGVMPPPTPKYTSESYQFVQDKQYAIKSEELVREMFAKDICTLTTENMVERNILNLNLIPFSNSESFSHYKGAKTDNFIPFNYFEDDHSFGRKKSFTDIITKFFAKLVVFIKTITGGVIILTNSGIIRENKESYIISNTSSIRNYGYNSHQEPVTYFYKEVFNSNKHDVRFLRYSDIKTQELKEIPSSQKVFLIDIFSFIKDFDNNVPEKITLDTDNFKDFVSKYSNLAPLQVVINYLIRKNFRNSIPIKW